MNTPCYVLEENLLRQNLELIKHVADEAGVEIILAFKAYALWKTFPIFREYISATTASSLNEALLAFREFGSKAHTFSPAYTDSDIDDITRCSSHITFNSLSQYERFHRRVHHIDPKVSLGLRINPEYSEIETDLYNPCAPGTRFGVTADKLSTFNFDSSSIKGFHCHCHCESGADVFARTLVHIKEKFSKWFDRIEWINFGGGHLMTHKDYDVPLLIETLRRFRAEYPHLKVILEPGSAFAWQTGYLVAQVADIVEDHGVRTAILNVSFTCHMPDCLEMPYMPTVRGAEIVDSPNLEAADGTNASEKAPIGDETQQGCHSETTFNFQLSTFNSPYQRQDCHAETAFNFQLSPFDNTRQRQDCHSETAFNFQLSPSDNTHQRQNCHPEGTFNSQLSTFNYTYRLGGCSCLAGDFLGTWRFDHELQIGEDIIFEDMLHYTTVKTNMFNGVSHPSIALHRCDGTLTLLRRFGYEDYLTRMD